MNSRTTTTERTVRKERPIRAQEREWHLPIKQRAAKDPHASMTVIRMNSTYLEVVDGMYPNRGLVGSFGLLGVTMFLCSFILLLYVVIFENYLNPKWDRQDEAEMLLALAFIAVFYAVFYSGLIYFLRKIGEWFGYTHTPIRLNRRNRKVYIWRGDGTVLEADWDKVYFSFEIAKRVAGITWLGISGLVLKDPETVEEAFYFGYTSASREYVLRYWEFLRRYMEEGPRAVMNAPGTEICLPIADKRETLLQGWFALRSEDASSPTLKWLMTPFHVLFFIGRLVHRVTSKVPLWPADVEAACRIEPGDKYVRDSSSNPEGYR